MIEQDEFFYKFKQVAIEIEDFDSTGFVLDIGGGGEGIIGRLKREQVIAIDIKKEELEEAADGPLKIVMDARKMMFLDHTFNTATAFFSFMYLPTLEDQQQVLAETFRVLCSGGIFHIWDVDLAERPETDKDYYLVYLPYKVKDYKIGTGYVCKWPAERRGEADYIALAQAAGFQHLSTEQNMNTFHMVFKKPQFLP